MKRPTREEAIKFIQERQKWIDEGKKWASGIGVFVCNPKDPVEKQISDYITNTVRNMERADRISEGEEILNKFLSTLSKSQRECVSEYMEDH